MDGLIRNTLYSGPEMTIAQEIDEMKYRQKGETFDGKIKRIARFSINLFNVFCCFAFHYNVGFVER